MCQWNYVPFLVEKQWVLPLLFIVVVGGCQTHSLVCAASPVPPSPSTQSSWHPHHSGFCRHLKQNFYRSLKICSSPNILWFYELNTYNLFSRMPQTSCCAVVPTCRGRPLALEDLISPLCVAELLNPEPENSDSSFLWQRLSVYVDSLVLLFKSQLPQNLPSSYHQHILYLYPVFLSHWCY